MSCEGLPDWLRLAWAQARAADAADLHLASGERPWLRVAGRLQELAAAPPSPPAPWPALAAALGLGVEHALASGGGPGEAEGLLADTELGRARWSLTRQRQGLLLVLRLLAGRVPTPAEVQLDATHAALMQASHGLLLVTGATGAGKSSTLAALVQHWRTLHAGHVLTLEDPVELLYPPGEGRVSQRDVGHDTVSFAAGLRAALRQDPDVILIGELRDAETARLALSAAETGHLVLATLHTAGCVGAIERLLSLFPADEQVMAQGLLADTLVAILAQELHWLDGRAHACREVLVATPAVRHLVRERRLSQIEPLLQTGAAAGMQTLAQARTRLGIQPP